MGYERTDRRYGRGRDQDRGEEWRYDRDRGYGASAPRASYAPREEQDGQPRRSPPPGYDYDERGFFDRAGDEVRSWFGDEEAERRRRWDERNARREYERYYGAGGYPGSPGSYAGFGASGPFGAGDWGMGFGMDRSAWGYDPSYHSWRAREVDAYDRDYEEYRRENQARFDKEFGEWRRRRQTQRDSLSRVTEHQEVIGSDGAHIGTVDHVRGDRILLTRSDKDAGGRHHSIPSSWIVRVDEKVEVSKTAEQAKDHWRDEERGNADRTDGPHILNRSFPGTY